MVKKLLWGMADLTAAALILFLIWYVNYQIPQKGVSAKVMEQTRSIEQERALQELTEGSTSGQGQSTGAVQDGTGGTGIQSAVQDGTAGAGMQSTVTGGESDWHEKFKDKFSDTVISTVDSYKSPDLSIQMSYYQYDSGILDHTSSGKHEKYGTRIAYTIADIYVGNIDCIQTAFAQDTYGTGYTEKLTDMSARMRSLLAVNGDSYSNNKHQDNGTIIRNGVIYRNKASDAETCVLNRDGTMDIYAPGSIDRQELIQRNAWQSWVFGPSLLDGNGKAKKDFITWNYITQSHPRTAIGYYEPGHYCLLLVDGRQDSSRGMFLTEMAAVFEKLGCQAAYNLDGGHCSFMTKGTEVVSHPYKPEHEIEDGIFIMDTSVQAGNQKQI